MADGWHARTGVPAWAGAAYYDGRVTTARHLEPAALDGAWTLLDERDEVVWEVTPIRLLPAEDDQGATFGVVVTRDGRPDALSATRHDLVESLRNYGGRKLGNRATKLGPADRAAYEACLLLGGLLTAPVRGSRLEAGLVVREAGYAVGTFGAFRPGDVEVRILLMSALALAEAWVDYQHAEPKADPG